MAIPAGLAVGSVLTLWTRDFKRLGAGRGGPWAKLPTVPVMHLEVTADAAVSPAYTIVGGPNGVGGVPRCGLTASGLPGPLVEITRRRRDHPPMLLTQPGPFDTPKFGMSEPGHPTHLGHPQHQRDSGITPFTAHPTRYPNTPHIGSTRYAAAVAAASWN